MIDRAFEFEEEKMPLPVSLSAAGLLIIFALGIAYRLLSFLVF